MLTIIADNPRYSSLGVGPCLERQAEATYAELLDDLRHQIQRYKVAQDVNSPLTLWDLSVVWTKPSGDYNSWSDSTLWCCLISLDTSSVDLTSLSAEEGFRCGYMDWKAATIITEIVKRSAHTT